MRLNIFDFYNKFMTCIVQHIYNIKRNLSGNKLLDIY
jgi:hypothetical protein